MSTIFSKTMIFAAAAVALGVTSNAAFAVTGRQAVLMCEQQAGCKYHLDQNGNIIITTAGGGHIFCTSASAECVPMRGMGAHQIGSEPRGRRSTANAGGNGGGNQSMVHSGSFNHDVKQGAGDGPVVK